MVVLATGTDRTGRQPAALDRELLARTDATLVFYMAVRGLPTIAGTLTALGRDPREPALVAERMGTAGERVVVGCLGDIAASAQAAGVEPPAVLVTGPTMAASSAWGRIRPALVGELLAAGG
jgi:siroheme synthase